MINQSNFTPTKMLRRKEVEARTGLKRSTIYEQVAKGLFPKPIRVGQRIVCWIELEIENWLLQKVKRSREANT